MSLFSCILKFLLYYQISHLPIVLQDHSIACWFPVYQICDITLNNASPFFNGILDWTSTGSHWKVGSGPVHISPVSIYRPLSFYPLLTSVASISPIFNSQFHINELPDESAFRKPHLTASNYMIFLLILSTIHYVFYHFCLLHAFLSFYCHIFKVRLLIDPAALGCERVWRV